MRPQFNKLLIAFKAGVTNSQRLVRLFFQKHLVAAAPAAHNDSALPAVVLSLQRGELHPQASHAILRFRVGHPRRRPFKIRLFHFPQLADAPLHVGEPVVLLSARFRVNSKRFARRRDQPTVTKLGIGSHLAFRYVFHLCLYSSNNFN